MTYRSFTWLTRRFPWVDDSVFVAYVRDVQPRDVIDAMTDGFRRTAIGLASVHSSDAVSTVGALQVDRWTVAVAPVNRAAVTEEIMAPLSARGEVLGHARDVTGHTHFVMWVDGRRTASFDPRPRCGLGPDPVPADWKSRIRQVGLDPDGQGPGPVGGDHLVEGSFAMAANHTGVGLTRDILMRSKFVLGSNDG